MKKIIIAIISICLIILCCFGCSKKTEKTKKGDSDIVETTLGKIADVAMVLDTNQNTKGDYMAFCVDSKENKTVLYTSTDLGTSWNAASTTSILAVNKELPKDAYITKGDISVGGDVVVCYLSDGKNENSKEATILFNVEGKTQSFTIKGKEGIYDIRFSDGQKNICVNRGNCVERYNQSGEKICIYEQESVIDYVEQEKSMILLGTDGLTAYNLDSGEKEESNSIIAEELKDEIVNLKEWTEGVLLGSNHIMQNGEDNTIYFLFNSGVYQYVMGNTHIVQLVGGGGYHFSTASCQVLGYWIQDEEHMRVLVSNEDGITTYSYTLRKDAPWEVVSENSSTANKQTDPDHPQGVMYEDGSFNLFGNYESPYKAKKNTKLNGTVTIYSLRDNGVLREAINVYQLNRPNVKVEWKVGIEEDSNISVEQAVNALNTSLLSGDGPDIILLDGLNRKKYEENGLLMDLGDVYQDMEKQYSLFTNVIEGYKDGGNIYVIPARFIPTILVGKKDVVNNIKTLGDLADLVEKDQTTWGNALDMYSVKQLYNTIYPCYSSAINKEDGTYEETELKDLITQMKRIWDSLQSQTKENDALTIYEEKKDGEKEISLWSTTIFNLRGLEIPDISHRTLGISKMYHSASMYYPIWDCRANDQLSYSAMPFGIAGSYEGYCCAAINAATTQKELAVDFVIQLLAPNEQSIYGAGEGFYGIPVNREGLRTEIATNTGVIGSDYAGVTVKRNNYFESQEEYDTFLSYLDGFNRAANMDEQTQEIIYENLEEYMNGKMSIEDYLSGVNEKMDMYMSE